MAYLDHRCRVCRHLKITHTQGSCSYNWCKRKCSLQRGDFGEPELIPTFTTDGEPNPLVTPPGDAIFYVDAGARNLYTCACEACAAMWKEPYA